APIRDAAGLISGVVLVFSDVTEQYRVAETLRASEERWKFAIEGPGDGLWDWNLQSGKAFFSPRYKAMLGFAEEDIGDSADEWSKRIHPEDAPGVLAVLQPYLEGKPGAAEVEFRMQCKDGSWLWILGRGLVVQRDGDGKPLRMIGTNRDITERKQAEKSLRDLITRNNDLLSAIPDIIMEVDALKRYKWANQAGLRFFGEDVLGREACEYYVEDDDTYAKVEPLFDGAGAEVSVDSWQCRTDGEKRLLSWLCIPLKDDQGQVIGALSSARDITERKQAAQALRESEATFRKLFEDSSDAILLIDGTGVFAECNQAALDLLRMTREQFLLLPPARISPEFQPDGRSSAEAAPEMIALAHSKGLHRFDWTCVNAEGGEFIVEVSLMPVTIKGQVMLLTTWRNITERKQAEKALAEQKRIVELVLEQSLAGYWDWLIQENEEYLSPTFKKMFGYEDHEMPNSPEAWQKIVFAEDLPGVFEVFKSHVESRGAIPYYGEVRYHHKDGSTVWVICTGQVIEWDKQGQPVRMIGCHINVTPLKLAEEEKLKLQTQLQQSQKMESLGTLAGGVAHDMNNVLGAILGLASAHIGSQPYGSPLHQALDTICKATERGGKMVKSLLSFARQSPAESQKLDMNALLRVEVSLLERTTLATVRLHLNLAAELRPILGDANALTHAFMNLCVNAVDAMPANGTLTLHTRNVDNDWIEVVVEDNGMGMPKEVLEKAMEPFFTTKETGKGTGLGLSMVFSTVKAHRGQIAIESEPGQGTRVMLRFPACEPDTPIRASASTVADAPLSAQGAKKVLLVDDDDLIQSSVQAILEVLGHTAVTAALSGEEALAKLEAGFEPDLIILDMNMPGMGGIGALPRLRALRPEVPILLATGRVDQSALALAAAHPGVTLMAKPFGLRELQRQMEALGLG
ncbi:MAG: PAS domain S-box protein, partial [Holophaga sp.]|nr:PAS domain S-box protein [Holophaga sp.]